MKTPKFKKMINDFLAEAEKKSLLPKVKKEKHNSLYHQDEPTGYIKPKKIEHNYDKDNKTEPDGQKEVNDRNTITAHEATEKSNLTEGEKLKKMQERLEASINETPDAALDVEEESLKEESRFDKLDHKLAHQKGITDPAALAASIGRKKYGDKKFGKMAHHESTDAMSQSVEIGDVRDMDEGADCAEDADCVNDNVETMEEDTMSKPKPKSSSTKKTTMKCADCGKEGERTGHQDCQYPQDHD